MTEDCISREQTKAEIRKAFPQLKDRVEINSILNELPSVKQEPKTGYWIWTLEDWNKWECSECGFTKRTDIHVRLGYNYCPHCGVRMEVEHD